MHDEYKLGFLKDHSTKTASVKTLHNLRPSPDPPLAKGQI